MKSRIKWYLLQLTIFIVLPIMMLIAPVDIQFVTSSRGKNLHTYYFFLSEKTADVSKSY